jgi:hypothetical protein
MNNSEETKALWASNNVYYLSALERLDDIEMLGKALSLLGTTGTQLLEAVSDIRADLIDYHSQMHLMIFEEVPANDFS